MFHSSIVRLAETVNHTLIGRRQMIVTAESCTGGLIAGALTDVPGSSEAVFGGYITYANEAKSGMIGVDRELIRDIWDELHAVLEGYLASITLDDLVQRKRQILGEIMYYI